MKTKKEIIDNWLPRYTGVPLEKFGKYIILVNFRDYVVKFSEKFGVEMHGQGKAMQSATHNGITIINFGMGSPNAATIMDLLEAIMPEAVLFLGKCGGVKKKNKVGDLILPIAAVRGDGTSDDYMMPEVPALPSFALQKVISTAIRENEMDYWTGTVYTTNRRIWEFDEEFKDYLRSLRVMAVEMETATIFTVGFHNRIPCGALLLVSDIPMIPEGVKTDISDQKVSSSFVDAHLNIGIQSLQMLQENHQTVRHLRF